MSVRWMLDTNIASWVIREAPAGIRVRIDTIDRARTCVSAITKAELLFGTERRPENGRLARLVAAFLSATLTEPWADGAAETYARLRATLEARGTPLAAMDLLIAAHAISLDCVLVTADRGFRQVPGLTIEDWSDLVDG
jgi:tRNA(fMet)-specific endonuclease VapC